MYTDFKEKMLYNETTFPIILAGLVGAVYSGEIINALIGGCTLFAIMYFVALFGGVGGVGGGDIKLAVGIGIWFGLSGTSRIKKVLEEIFMTKIGTEILKVSAKSSPNKVAGALASFIRKKSQVELHAVGAGVVNQTISRSSEWDYKFKNTRDKPIVVFASQKNSKLIIELYEILPNRATPLTASTAF
jgi:Flp pilus assembly protein protease CpaA